MPSLPAGDGGATEPKAFTCPEPPADALRFEAGTLHADRIFGRDISEPNYYGDPPRWDMPDGMVLILTGVSYVAEDHCINLTEYFDSSEYGSVWLLTDPIKNGERVGDYLFKLNLTIPGASLSDYIGEFTDGGGHTANPSFSAHQLMLGWHDGEKYHHVYSLPDGMTKSTVCVESFSREHMKLTVLFDPLDGPFTTNHHTQLHQPIFFTADIWATNMGPDQATRSRSCMMNVADGSKTLDEIFAE